MTAGKPLLVLVHPGSLCGSFDFHYEFSASTGRLARTERDLLCKEVQDFEGELIGVFDGALDDEISSRPTVNAAVERIRAIGTFLTASPIEADLRASASSIWNGLGGNGASRIVVTGAWADKGDGCAWTIYDSLRRRAGRDRGKVVLSELVATTQRADELRDEWSRLGSGREMAPILGL